MRGILFAVLGVVMLTPAFGRPAAAADVQFFSTKINVTDLDRSIEFYTKVIGLKVAARTEGRIIEVLLTPGEEVLSSTGAFILVYDKERKEPLVVGNGFNNVTFGYPAGLKAPIARLEAAGYKVRGSAELRPSPTPMAKFIAVAFTKDPDGYTLELLQRAN